MWTNVTEEMLLNDSGHKNSLNRSAIKRNSLRISLFFMRMVMISERDLSQAGTGRLAYRQRGACIISKASND